MYFANPWGLLGLLALPAIAVIHLFHRRFPPLPIAGLHLWGVETRKESPGRKRERLPLTRTLMLELLAALLLTLLIADPRDAASGTRTHLVAVLDNSASMSAVDKSGRSSRDRAVEWLKAQQEELGRTSAVSILTTGRRPTLIAGPRTDWQEAITALENWIPVETAHGFEPAWDLGAQLAGEESEFVFLTDRLPAEEIITPKRMETQSFGKPLSNVAITAARWTFSPEEGAGSLFVRIANLGEDTAELTLKATSDGQPVLEETQSLPGGSEKTFEWQVPGGLGQLTFTAEKDGDPLSLDNELQLVEPEVRLVNVAVVLPSSHPAFEPVKRILGVLPTAQLADPVDADLVIAPASDTPIDQPGLWWLGLGPLDISEEARAESKTLLGPYLVEKRHPLMNGIVLGGVVWGGVQDNPGDTVPVISTGGSLLFGERAGTSADSFVMNVDLLASNLTESPDWPIFWTNLMEQCRITRPGFRRWNYQLEEPILFSLSPEEQESEEPLTLRFGEDEKPLLRLNTVEISPRDQVGIYEVYSGEEQLDTFAVNFLDRQESDLLELVDGERAPSEQAIAAGIRWDNPFSWLLAIGILATMVAIYADWIILRRRS